MRVEIIENDNKLEFEEKLEKFINMHSVHNAIKDIKFAVTPDIHSSGFSSYSNGETYYAMVIYGD